MVASAAAMWGTIGTVQSTISPGVSLLWICSARFAIAALFFLVCLLLKKNACLRRLELHEAWMIMLAAASIIGNNFFFLYGIRATGVAVGSVATIGSAPIWAALLNVLFGGRIPRQTWWAGVLISSSGIAFIAFLQSEAWMVDIPGLLACLLAGLGYAMFTQCLRVLIKKHPQDASAFWIFLLSSIFTICLTLYTTPLPSKILLSDVLALIYLGLFATGISFFLYATALKSIPASTGVALTLIDPLTSFVLALLVLHEPLQLISLAGLAAILIGLFIVMRSDARITQEVDPQ